MRDIRLYIEGGGDSKKTSTPLRRGFHAFFSSIREMATQKRIRFNLIMGGSASETCKDFFEAGRANPEAVTLLLLDSDCPVSPAQEDYLFLRQAHGCQVSKDSCHLMVQIMEAWFLTDLEALKNFYGNDFNERKIPGNPRVEEVDKGQILNGLKEATQNTRKKSYHKIHHASELLALIDPAKVRQAAPHCDRLLTALEELVAS